MTSSHNPLKTDRHDFLNLPEELSTTVLQFAFASIPELCLFQRVSREGKSFAGSKLQEMAEEVLPENKKKEAPRVMQEAIAFLKKINVVKKSNYPNDELIKLQEEIYKELVQKKNLPVLRLLMPYLDFNFFIDILHYVPHIMVGSVLCRSGLLKKTMKLNILTEQNPNHDQDIAAIAHLVIRRLGEILRIPGSKPHAFGIAYIWEIMRGCDDPHLLKGILQLTGNCFQPKPMPILIGALKQHKSPEIIFVLVEAGANPTEKYLGQNAFDLVREEIEQLSSVESQSSQPQIANKELILQILMGEKVFEVQPYSFGPPLAERKKPEPTQEEVNTFLKELIHHLNHLPRLFKWKHEIQIRELKLGLEYIFKLQDSPKINKLNLFERLWHSSKIKREFLQVLREFLQNKYNYKLDDTFPFHASSFGDAILTKREKERCMINM